MDIVIVLLRALHIVFGVFWVGTMFFVATLLVPSIGDAGPAGGAVMMALVKRRMLVVLPGAATITLLSGIWLYWKISDGFSGTWMQSRMAMTLGTGAVLGLVAYGIGMLIMRPAQMKMIGLVQAMPQTPEGPAREAAMAEVGRLRARAGAAGRVVASLLGLAVLAMAVARYI